MHLTRQRVEGPRLSDPLAQQVDRDDDGAVDDTARHKCAGALGQRMVCPTRRAVSVEMGCRLAFHGDHRVVGVAAAPPCGVDVSVSSSDETFIQMGYPSERGIAGQRLQGRPWVGMASDAGATRLPIGTRTRAASCVAVASRGFTTSCA